MRTGLTAILAALALTLPVVVSAQEQPEVAGRVGDRVITLKEVDEAWQKADATAHMRATQLLYQGRKEALDRLIGDLIIERAAKARGVPPEQFAKDEMAKRMKPVTDADVAAFYEQNKARMQGKSLEEMQGAIRQFLEQQQTAGAREALLTELRKGGPAVVVSLDPPRQAVEVAAGDPSRGPANAAVTLVEFSDYQ